MTKQPSDTSETHFPALATPARRASGSWVRKARAVRTRQRSRIAELHGRGPYAMEQPCRALAGKHLSGKEKQP